MGTNSIGAKERLPGSVPVWHEKFLSPKKWRQKTCCRAVNPVFLAGDGAEFSDFGFLSPQRSYWGYWRNFFALVPYLSKLSLKIPEPEPHDKGPAQEHWEPGSNPDPVDFLFYWIRLKVMRGEEPWPFSLEHVFCVKIIVCLMVPLNPRPDNRLLS